MCCRTAIYIYTCTVLVAADGERTSEAHKKKSAKVASLLIRFFFQRCLLPPPLIFFFCFIPGIFYGLYQRNECFFFTFEDVFTLLAAYYHIVFSVFVSTLLNRDHLLFHSPAILYLVFFLYCFSRGYMPSLYSNIKLSFTPYTSFLMTPKCMHVQGRMCAYSQLLTSKQGRLPIKGTPPAIMPKKVTSKYNSHVRVTTDHHEPCGHTATTYVCVTDQVNY